MTETIAYIKESLKDLYPTSEINSLVRLIMERVCNIQRHHFILCTDKQLPENEKRQIHNITERLRQMEPIQYILETADFYSLLFEVNPSVLIPRPETEELVEQVILDNTDKKIQILDIGTGSGCIAVTLRKNLEKATVIATDISSAALETARRNAKRNHVPVTFIQTDILNSEKAETDIPFFVDIIVSNPPYIKEEEKKEMEKNVLDYEPPLALFVPDDDPLLFYRHIARFGQKRLADLFRNQRGMRQNDSRHAGGRRISQHRTHPGFIRKGTNHKGKQMKQLSESEMLHRAAAYCSAGERCIQDMEKKIKAAGLTEEESDRIIARLLEERFIDESRFARYFVNDKLRFNKWGRVKINYEMQRKGIPSGIRSEALAGIDEQEYCSILLSLLKSKKKATRGKNDREIYAKLLRFAFGRGFEAKETSGCLKQLFDKNDFEDDFE